MYSTGFKVSLKASINHNTTIYSQLCIEDLESIAVALRRDPQPQEVRACERSEDEGSYIYEYHNEITCK